MASDGSRVEHIETETAGDDDEETPVALEELSEDVLGAISSNYPGARVIEAAESEDDDGEKEYDISIEDGDRVIGLTVSEDGEVLETEVPSEMPPGVREWLNANYPRARFDETLLVTEEGVEAYEVSFVSAGGVAFEAKFQVTPAPSTGDSGAAIDNSPPPELDAVVSAEAGSPDASLTQGLSEGFQGFSNAQVLAVAPAQAAVAQAESPGAPQPGKQKSEDPPQPLVASSDQSQTDLVTEAFQALLANAGLTQWLPGVAGLLSDVLPLDIAALQAELDKILADIDVLTRKLTQNPGGADSKAQIALLAALVGAALLLLDSRRARNETGLSFNTANSTWSWVVGTTDPKKHRNRSTSR